MAEQYVQNRLYQYSENANLVLQADRSQLPRRGRDEPNGEATSLRGKLRMCDFGSRVTRSVAPRAAAVRMRDTVALGAAPRLVRGAGGGGYAPRTRDTAHHWQLLVHYTASVLGDQPPDVLHAATHDLVEALRRHDTPDRHKRAAVEAVLLRRPLTEEVFSQLLTTARHLTDYDDQLRPDATSRDDRDVDLAPAAPDLDGIAIDFDEEEQEPQLSDRAIHSLLSQDATHDPNLHFEEGGVRNNDEDSSDDDDHDAENQSDHPTGEELHPDRVLVQRSTTSDGVAPASRKSGTERIAARDIDAFWLQKRVSAVCGDAEESHRLAEAVLAVVARAETARDCENALVELLGQQDAYFALIRLVTLNRERIHWCTRLARTTETDRATLFSEMRNHTSPAVTELLRELQQPSSGVVGDGMQTDVTAVTPVDRLPADAVSPILNLNLSDLAFAEGSHVMSSKVVVPLGTQKLQKKGYEEIVVPAPVRREFDTDTRPVAVASMRPWMQAAFGVPSLNLVQSRVYDTAVNSDANMLICAPTGAGKTNVALLTMLRAMEHFLLPDGSLRRDDFKMVYIAPMKALVQEMVGNFTRCLAPYGLTVAELTGDAQLTKHQISQTQLIITTPEKWDIITRKSTDRSYTNLVTLIIIDEIHLLHDDRGPVIESVVTRTRRLVEQTNQPVRIVGLSATLPNYRDVAVFLKVEEEHTFFFDGGYRPCPLKQTFIGVSEKKAMRRYQMMNDILYTKVTDFLTANSADSILIFTHSRKETLRTAQYLREKAIEENKFQLFIPADHSPSKEILSAEALSVKTPGLAELLESGLAIHHAGMGRADRTSVEELFEGRHVRVLVSTATLAWGVNLPAHVVIIRGTQVYNPEKGCWVELSPQDILQMLGRAGRPKYDTHGEGVIITTNHELGYYLSLLGAQLPIESQLMSRLPDCLNAEIVSGTIRSRADAVQWLSYTYLYIRMIRAPGIYGIPVELREGDPSLLQWRTDVAHAALVLLDKCHLLKYDKRSGALQCSDLGRIASHYYITHLSMSMYHAHLKPFLSDVDLLRLFANSDEFKLIPVREEEKMELAKLLEAVPIPVKETVDEPKAKVNVLLQAFISQLRLDGFVLIADMTYVTQSAGRILRALFEIALNQNWANLAKKLLRLCIMVERRAWFSSTPIRQFQDVPVDLIKQLERSSFSWERYFDLSKERLKELLKTKHADRLSTFLHYFPRLELQVHYQPVTASMLSMDIVITPNFEYVESVHGPAVVFWVMVQDVNGENLLHYESFILKPQYALKTHYLSFKVKMFEPVPPNYIVTVMADKWLHAEAQYPVTFNKLVLPDKFSPPTVLLDMQPLSISALKNLIFQKIYEGDFSYFNALQTQVFNTLYHSDDNCFVGASPGSGKTVCAELAMLRVWANASRLAREHGLASAAPPKIVYISPYPEAVERRLVEWRSKFAHICGGLAGVAKLDGDAVSDMKAFENANLILSPPGPWDVILRKWKKSGIHSRVGLLIVDDAHLIHSEVGATIEAIISRSRYIAAETKTMTRIVCLAASTANALDMGEWIGCTPSNTYNFKPEVRSVESFELYAHGFSIPHFPSLMLTMAEPTYRGIVDYAAGKPALVFVPSRKQSVITACDLKLFALQSGNPNHFLNFPEARDSGMDMDDQPGSALDRLISRIDCKELKDVVRSGVGFFHEALSTNDQDTVRSLFNAGILQVVVASRETVWSISLRSYLVVIMGTQFYNGQEHRYEDYQVRDVLEMAGLACRPRQDPNGCCLLLCHTNKKDYFKKFFEEPLPVESHLDQVLHDHFNAEIFAKTITNKQEAVDYLTWTFLYRRVTKNPSFYGLPGRTKQHLNDYLSDLVESTLQDLADANCISIDEETGMDVESLNFGMISAYYNIYYQTMDLFGRDLKKSTRSKGLLDALSRAAEFENLAVRKHEDRLLKMIYDRVPVKSSFPDFGSAAIKVNVLLQAHFSRMALPADLAADQKVVLVKLPRLIQACIDVVNSQGWLSAALAAMELSQMTIQALWNTDSPLKQLPHFTPAVIGRFQTSGVDRVLQLFDLEDEHRDTLLQMSTEERADVARAVNQWPCIAMNVQLLTKGAFPAGSTATLRVALEREDDEDDHGNQSFGQVYAPYYPKGKEEGWWFVVGNPTTNTLLASKRFTVKQSLDLSIDFSVPEEAGTHELKVYLICDAYLDVDQEDSLTITVLDTIERMEVDEDE